ncbi:MAG: hypothetical protein ABI382_10725, partial [Nakamurella sp.]
MVGATRNLLDELSWEGNAIPYRNGGRGRENVLTAEVFRALDFLPRVPFLDAVLRSAGVGADAEGFDVDVLPGDEQIAALGIRAQPDVLLTSASHYILVEAKGMKPGASFQPEQLYREAMIAEHCSGG